MRKIKIVKKFKVKKITDDQYQKMEKIAGELFSELYESEYDVLGFPTPWSRSYAKLFRKFQYFDYFCANFYRHGFASVSCLSDSFLYDDEF